MVAGVILFRLYTVLGRRTGHEPQSQDRINPISSAAQFARFAGGAGPASPRRALCSTSSWPTPVSRPDISSKAPDRPMRSSSRPSPAATAPACARFCRMRSMPPLTGRSPSGAARPPPRHWPASPTPRSSAPHWRTRPPRSRWRSAPSSPAARLRPAIMSSAKSPMSGPSPARSAHPIPTGPWWRPAAPCPEAQSRCRCRHCAVAGGAGDLVVHQASRRVCAVAAFSELPGWQSADLRPALAAFARSCAVIAGKPAGEPMQRAMPAPRATGGGLRRA